jgi:glucose-1-phosphate thymidylyltransferase
MNVVIPAAGEGVRLRPHTHTIPKPLINVAGKPIIGHIIDSIIPLNPEKICIVVGHHGIKIEDFVRKNYPAIIDKFLFVHQEKRQGLGHAIFVSLEHIKKEEILIILGDTIFDVDYNEIINANKNIIAVSETDEPQRFGIVEIEGEMVKDMIEKPQNPLSNLAIVGIYYFKNGLKLFNSLRHIIDNNLRTKNEFQLTDAMKHLLKEEEIYIKRIKGWYDCGKIETLLETNRYLLNKFSLFKSYKNTSIIPPVYIPDDVEISNSVIGPYVSCGRKVKIKNAIIKDSIINDGGKVENVLLSNSIIGTDAVIIENFKVVNIGDSSIIEPVKKEV